MCINGLSPLQNWIERIQAHLTKKEILKARFSSLVLPIFEAMEFFNVMKKICIRSSDTVQEPLSHLLVKASFLAFNIFFSSYQGFRNPQRVYQFHQNCGLVDKEEPFFEETHDKVKVDEPSLGFQKFSPQKVGQEDLATVIEHKEEKVLEGNKLFLEDPLPNLVSKETVPSQPSAEPRTPVRSHGEGSPNKNDSRLKSFIKNLMTSPLKMQQEALFLSAREKITHQTPKRIRKKQRASCHVQLRFDDSPSEKEQKICISQIKNQTPAPSPHPRIAKLKSDSRVGSRKEDTKKSSSGSPLSSSSDELKPILALIQQTIPEKGSWKVTDHQVQFRSSKTFHLDPAIIDVLSDSEKKGHLSSLTFDQTFTLNQNLKLIDAYLETRKSTTQIKLFKLTQVIQKQLITLWIAEDYQQGLLYSKCDKLISRIIHLMEGGEGGSTQGHARLFEEASFSELLDLIEEWQTSHFLPINPKQPFKTEKDFTIYQAYEILKTFLQKLPDSVCLSWGSLKQASSKNEWFKIIARLPPQDKEMIDHLLEMLHVASIRIWKQDLAGMLKATDCVTSLICPPHKLEVNLETQIAVADFTILSEIISTR